MKLGPFQVEEQVGKGGMAVVHRAVWTGGVRPVPVAVKFLTGNDNETADVIFPREARHAARLSHPNVVTLLDIGRTDESGVVAAGTPYLVMEWVDGGSLATSTIESWDELRTVLTDVAQGLAHAHARGVLHRDVKPGNVLRTKKEGIARLVDFGIARAVEDEGKVLPEGRIVGTPNYMAPEQIRGTWRDEGPWTDVYGLGALAWRLSTGSTLYSGSPPEVLRAHVESRLPQFEPLFDVPKEFEDWLRGALDKSPAKRFRGGAEAARALQDLDEGRPTREYEALQPGKLHARIAKRWATEDRAVSTELRAAGAGLFGMRQAPIVGREREKRILWDEYRKADETESPRLVVLEGEAGTGKSALAQWLARRVREADLGEVLVTAHEPTPVATSGLRGTVTSFFRLRGLARTESFSRLQRELDRLGFETSALTAMDVLERLDPGESHRRGLANREDWFRFLADFAAALAHRDGRPVLWIVDDAQWAAITADFVLWAMKQPIPVLFVVTRRGETPFFQGANFVDLPGLAESDLRQFVRNLLPVAPAVEDVVVRRAVDSPLFAAQLIGDWVDRNALEPTPVGYQVSPKDLSELPQGIHAIWQQRLRSALPEPNNDVRLVEAAAILGSEFDFDEWEATCAEMGLEPTPEVLDRLARQGLLEETASGYRFSHTLLRDSVLREAPEPQRTHASAARALVRMGSSSGARRERVARHLHAAEHFPQAFQHLTEAMATYWEEEQFDAVVLLGSLLAEWAADANETDTPRHALGLVWYGAVLRFRAGRIGEIRPHFERAVELIGGEQKLHELTERPDPVESQVAFRATAELAMADYYARSERDETLRQLVLARDIARCAGLKKEEAFAAIFEANALIDIGRVDEAEDRIAIALSRLQEVEGERSKFGMSAHLQRSRVLEHQGDYEGALAAARYAEELARAVGHRTGIALCLVRIAELTSAIGQFDVAKESAVRAQEIYAASGARSAELCDLNSLGYELQSGEVDADHLRRAEHHIELWAERGFPRMVGAARIFAAICAARDGAHRRAQRELDRGLETLDQRIDSELVTYFVVLFEHTDATMRDAVGEIIRENESFLSPYFRKRFEAALETTAS